MMSLMVEISPTPLLYDYLEMFLVFATFLLLLKHTHELLSYQKIHLSYQNSPLTMKLNEMYFVFLTGY